MPGTRSRPDGGDSSQPSAFGWPLSEPGANPRPGPPQMRASSGLITSSPSKNRVFGGIVIRLILAGSNLIQQAAGIRLEPRYLGEGAQRRRAGELRRSMSRQTLVAIL